MSSFIFSFRAVFLALGVIAATEGVCALALRPGIVERTKFNLIDRFHSAVIFGKLDDFADSAPDIVQVGDSSGFHGVRPDFVMRYLGGLKYVNLSCCAALGYDGYYGIADFMLRRNPGIKAVVLYVSLNNLPRADLIDGQHQLGAFIQNSLTTPFAYLSPATVALRQRIVDAMEKKGQAKTDAVFTEDMRVSARAHHGWWAEHDRRLAGDKRTAFWREACGPRGVKIWNDERSYYAPDGQSYTLAELERFALLTAHHGAKLIVLFHPFSCPRVEGSFLDARRADIRTLVQRHQNVIALPEQMVEPWPTEEFVSSDHLRVGYDEENGKRVGKLLAEVFGLAARSDAPDDLGAAETTPPGTLPSVSAWTADGAVVTPGSEPRGAQRLIESMGPGTHGIETKLTGLMPGRTLVLSFAAKAIGARGVFVEVLAHGNRGGGYCDLYGATAQRDGDMRDAGIEPDPDGWSRCWVAMPVEAPEVTLRLSLMNERLDPAYVGDGKSGALLGLVAMRETTRFLAQEASPW
ncbi:MAG: hypothetical protein JO220_09930 [Hyphomicrobiales bacterium]|nr:hypothetical protein [Hyphomicrobiales bacterium]